MSLLIDGTSLTVDDIYRIGYTEETLELSSESMKRVVASFERVQEWGRKGHPIYGVNTGFGEMISVIIPPEKGSELQCNLLRSHAGGGGQPFSDQISRAILATRANCLIKGHSGISPTAVELMKEMVNRHIYPLIPQQGSLGASGDLAPLASMALTVIGDGHVRYQGEVRRTGDVFKQVGLKPLVPGFKEALAMINGTTPMTAVGAIAVHNAKHLLRMALLISSDVVQCLNASTRPFEHRGNALKNHRGQVAVARIMRELLADSKLVREHQVIMNTIEKKADELRQKAAEVIDTKVYLQNAYSLRAMPQILGLSLETFDFAERIIQEEANSCNDNPLIFDTPEESFHGANFHGQYVASANDYMNIALTEIGVLAERQLNRLVDPHLNNKLPAFLGYQKENVGLFMGFQGMQYLATSIASENLDLAAPASIKSIPSNGQNQDVVSMGLNAGRRSLALVENVASILAVTLGAAAQASHFVGRENFSPVIQELHERLPVLKQLYKDESPGYELIQNVRSFILSDEARAFARKHVTLDAEA